MAGYSGKPLWQKLGFKPGFRVYLDTAPDNYRDLLGAKPPDVTFAAKAAGHLDMVHLFTRSQADLKRKLNTYISAIVPAGVIWVSWPKKAAKSETDVTEDAIRAAALPLGLVDVKVCAVDETWSGLKLVIRKENRKSAS